MAEASSITLPEPERPLLPSTDEAQPSPSISPPKKIHPLPWSHIETVNLIESYQEKWYSLKRGQLKASQWEEVAVSVAARCGYEEPSKTSIQCRHKMEKLRKRYRSEKQRSTASPWPYFELMDLMERGPFPISARPIPLIGSSLPRISHSTEDDNDDDDDDDDADDNDGDETNKSRSINHIIRRRPAVSSPVLLHKKASARQWNSGGGGGGGGSGAGVSRFLRNPMFRKRRRSYEMDEEELEQEDVGEGAGGKLLSELAAVVRSFGEGFVRMENMKIEMMKETQRYRMEMETKRTEMILESQSRIVDMVAKALGAPRKDKKTQET